MFDVDSLETKICSEPFVSPEKGCLIAFVAAGPHHLHGASRRRRRGESDGAPRGKVGASASA